MAQVGRTGQEEKARMSTPHMCGFERFSLRSFLFVLKSIYRNKPLVQFSAAISRSN